MALSDGIRKVFLAGVGALAITGEKSKQLIEELVKKGELTVEEGRSINEELARKVSEKADKIKNMDIGKSVRSHVIHVEKMSKEEREELLARIREVEEAEAMQEMEDLAGDPEDIVETVEDTVIIVEEEK